MLLAGHTNGMMSQACMLTCLIVCTCIWSFGKYGMIYMPLIANVGSNMYISNALCNIITFVVTK